MRPFRIFAIAILYGILLAGCGAGAKASTNSSGIEARFDTLDSLNDGKFIHSDPTTHAINVLVSRTYSRLFSSFQTHNFVAKSNDTDLSLLFRAASEVQFYTSSPRYVSDMSMDLAELDKRGIASEPEYYDMYEAYIGSRMFSQARELAISHQAPAIERYHTAHGDVIIRQAMAPVPTYRDLSDDGRTGPTQITLSVDGKELVRRDIDVNVPAQIVVVISPLCHFVQGGISDIDHSRTLGPVFERNAIWLIPPSGTPDFKTIAEWNSAHPREVMNLAFDEQEWPSIDRWETPVFYFFKQKKMIAEVIGWPRSPGGNTTKVRAALERIGLL